ncbi:hypothetical protein Nepgr_030194 [Nepenthes gracilis]|uniref:Uncharacterized protein n=1 Tax=Nepenthes gracilis TaxID=150966 RepID=A0AAD3Y6B5_NEPGR|nr:hypothetical protein Nepgr_030194 [Nepenthes gracilis]
MGIASDLAPPTKELLIAPILGIYSDSVHGGDTLKDLLNAVSGDKGKEDLLLHQQTLSLQKIWTTPKLVQHPKDIRKSLISRMTSPFPWSHSAHYATARLTKLAYQVLTALPLGDFPITLQRTIVEMLPGDLSAMEHFYSLLPNSISQAKSKNSSNHKWLM